MDQGGDVAIGGTGGAADSMSGEEGEVQLQPLQPAAPDTQPRKERLEAALKVDQEGFDYGLDIINNPPVHDPSFLKTLEA
jgi:hypothetical protein